jgi:hypothetical protein
VEHGLREPPHVEDGPRNVAFAIRRGRKNEEGEGLIPVARNIVFINE